MGQIANLAGMADLFQAFSMSDASVSSSDSCCRLAKFNICASLCQLIGQDQSCDACSHHNDSGLWIDGSDIRRCARVKMCWVCAQVFEEFKGRRRA